MFSRFLIHLLTLFIVFQLKHQQLEEGSTFLLLLSGFNKLYSERNRVFYNKSNLLTDSTQYITSDLPYETRARNRTINKIINEQTSKGNNASRLGDHLVINGNQFEII